MRPNYQPEDAGKQSGISASVDQSWLGGKVTKKTLPLLKPPALDPGSLKRLALTQGELAQFHNGSNAAQYIAFVELIAGLVRGNHYHRFKEEFMYVARGELELKIKDLDSNETERISLHEGDLVRISTGVAHALRATKSGCAIEFSPVSFDPTDSYPCPLGDF